MTEIITGFGEVQRTSRDVVKNAVGKYRDYISSEAPVGEYLTDQLILLLAMAGSGAFRCTQISRHSQTNIHLIQQFLDCRIDSKDVTDLCNEITVTT